MHCLKLVDTSRACDSIFVFRCSVSQRVWIDRSVDFCDLFFKELEGSRGALQKAEGVIEMSKKKNVDINGDSKTGNDDILDIPLDPSEVKILKKDVDGHLFIPSDISNDAEYLFQNYSPMLNCKKFEKAVKTINLKKRFSSSFWHIAKFSELIENLSNNTKYSKYSPSFRLHGFNW